ncbi:hypothetical protein HNR29_004910 [Rhizobium leguminosarum]|nr:hypothetical protein [Rhizobium leguminosarum]
MLPSTTAGGGIAARLDAPVKEERPPPSHRHGTESMFTRVSRHE